MRQSDGQHTAYGWFNDSVADGRFRVPMLGERE